MSFTVGTYPFGKVVKFGGMDFNGPGWPTNVNIDWQTSPIMLIDSAFPSDPFTDRPATNAIQRLSYKYGIIAGRDSLSHDPDIPTFIVPDYPKYAPDEATTPHFFTPLQSIEYQWNVIYLNMRQHKNQSCNLIANSANSNHDYAYAKARIEKLDLNMSPGANVFSYLVDMSFTLLSPWLQTDPLIHINNTTINDKLVGDVHVPFGNLVSFNGFPFTNTLLPGNPRIPSTIVQNYTVEWATQYKIMPHKQFPMDLFGSGPCPLKPITAEWEVAFLADTPPTTTFTGDFYTLEHGGAGYYNVYQQYNAFLVAMMGGDLNYNGTAKGQLVCEDAWGNTGVCTARLKHYPLSLTPTSRTHYIAKITFDILSDWTYAVEDPSTNGYAPIYNTVGVLED